MNICLIYIHRLFHRNGLFGMCNLHFTSHFTSHSLGLRFLPQKGFRWVYSIYKFVVSLLADPNPFEAHIVSITYTLGRPYAGQFIYIPCVPCLVLMTKESFSENPSSLWACTLNKNCFHKSLNNCGLFSFLIIILTTSKLKVFY